MTQDLRCRWLHGFIERVLQALAEDAVWGYGGNVRVCRRKKARMWEVSIAPFRVELKEMGPADGRTVRLEMFCDLSSIAKLFDVFPRIEWVIPAVKRGRSGRMVVLFLGAVRGRTVILKLFARPFDDATGTLIFDRQSKKLWLSPSLGQEQ